MSNAKHTPGRVRAGLPSDAIVVDVVGRELKDSDAYYGGHLIAESMSEANRRRMIACWNACEGIPIEVLEANQSGGLPYSVADQIDERVLKTELLQALEGILKADEWTSDAALIQDSELQRRATKLHEESMDKARAAIAKATGGQ